MSVILATVASLGEKYTILENILQDVLQDLESQCIILANSLARFLQEMNCNSERYARKISYFQNICMLRLRILEVSKNHSVVFSLLNNTE